MLLARLLTMLRLRARHLLRRASVDRELAEELEYHVSELNTQLEARGISAQHVRRESALAIGGMTRRREEMRDAHGMRIIDDFFRDLRYALRSMRRTPLASAVGVLTLALGIATATTVFAFMDAALLRPPPFKDASRLAILNITRKTAGQALAKERWSWTRFRLLQQNAKSFSVASVSNAVLTMSDGESAQPLPAEIVSSRYFAVMQQSLLIGAPFSSSEDNSASALPLIILGDAVWKQRFGGRKSAVGSTVLVNGLALTVAGVAAPNFSGISGQAQAWIPVGIAPRATYSDYQITNQNFITVIGRLKDNISLGAANSELNVLGEQIQELEPSELEAPDDHLAAGAVSFNQARINTATARGLVMMAAAVALLVLIACANVATLLLGRAAERRREIAIRLAVGASRGRLLRQLLTESSVMAFASGVLGLALAGLCIKSVALPAALSGSGNFYGAIGAFAEAAIDWRILSFTVFVSAATVAFFGLAPAIQAVRADVTGDLKGGGNGLKKRGRVFGFSSGQDWILATQIAMSVVLLSVCGLLLASFARLVNTPTGFQSSGLLTFMIRPSEVLYPPDKASLLLDRVLEEIEGVPGVLAASVDGCAPMAVVCANATLHIVGKPQSNGASSREVLRHYVGPSHFTALGVPLIRGRVISRNDRAGAPHVVVINQAAAHRFWPDENALGKRVWWDAAPQFGSADSSAEIIGIVADVAYQPLSEHPVQPDFFTPYAQFTYASRMVLVRTTGDPLSFVAAVGQAVHRADPALAMFEVMSMSQRAALSWAPQRFQSAMLTVIAAIALLFAISGVFAVTAFFVAIRRREIGTRMALGASNGNIVRTAMSHTMKAGSAGAIAGIVAAIATNQLIRSMLYNTSALDPLVYAAVILTLVVSLLLATFVPVRRALSVDPVEVLRGD